MAGMGRPRRLVLWLAPVVAGVALAAVAARGSATRATPAEEVRAVASTLRCPVCQNLSVADSSSRLAHEMRADIARDLEAGKSADQIRDEFVAAYGQWILLAPSKSGINWVAWAAPVLLLVVGGAVAAGAVRRWALGGGHDRQPGDRPLDSDDRALLERSLAAQPEEPA
jgi:cytochrome c-type biogenesis protein CcmH